MAKATITFLIIYAVIVVFSTFLEGLLTRVKEYQRLPMVLNPMDIYGNSNLNKTSSIIVFIVLCFVSPIFRILDLIVFFYREFMREDSETPAKIYAWLLNVKRYFGFHYLVLWKKGNSVRTSVYFGTKNGIIEHVSGGKCQVLAMTRISKRVAEKQRSTLNKEVFGL